MATNREFEKVYSINVARLKNGPHIERFELDQTFFDHFEYSLTKSGKLEVLLDLQKYDTHLDVKYHFKGTIELPCDRCNMPYSHEVDNTNRIIYSFDKKMDFEGYEVMYVNNQEAQLTITQELYDFIQLAIPIRKVPDKEVHLCKPEILAMLGLNEEGLPIDTLAEDEETHVDPRWAALQKLKGETDSEQ